jgi:hypothetical protein
MSRCNKILSVVVRIGPAPAGHCAASGCLSFLRDCVSGHLRSTSRFAPAIRTRTIARVRSISAVRRPCVVRAARIRSSPSAVRGPVDSPPCILHHPASIAGASQGVPALVRAPHLGAASAKGRVIRQSGTRRLGFFRRLRSHSYPFFTFDTAGWTLPTIACPPSLTTTRSTLTTCGPLPRFRSNVSRFAASFRSLLAQG